MNTMNSLNAMQQNEEYDVKHDDVPLDRMLVSTVHGIGICEENKMSDLSNYQKGGTQVSELADALMYR